MQWFFKRRLIICLVLGLFSASACNLDFGPAYQRLLSFDGGLAYGLFADDLDADGLKDIMIISHAANHGRVHLQKSDRKFIKSQDLSLGFHPGLLYEWPELQGERRFLLSAEGSNGVWIYQVDKAGVLRKTGDIPEHAPIQTVRFDWPDWEGSLAVRPYQSSEIVLWRQFDPLALKYKQRLVLPLTQSKPTLWDAGSLVVADIDADQRNELLFTNGFGRGIMKIAYPQNNEVPKAELIARLDNGVPNQILLADLNGDKAQDLLVPEKLPGDWMTALINDGHGSFTKQQLKNPVPGEELQGFDIKSEKDGYQYLLVGSTSKIHLMRFKPNPDSIMADLQISTIPRQEREPCFSVLLDDLDGDGWQDAVVGLARPGYGAWVVFGPLWKHFQDMEKKQFKLANKSKQ